MTYRKKKGFHPVHLIWNNYIIDTLFRGGSRHCNSGEAAQKMILNTVKRIRKHYSESVVIIICLDAGYFDQKVLNALDDANVGFICGAKNYSFVQEYIDGIDKSMYQEYQNKKKTCYHLEFGYRCQCWERFYRCIYIRVEDKME